MLRSYRGDRKYLTLATRVGGRVVHDYLGCGEEALQAAAEIERRRAERTARSREAYQHRQPIPRSPEPLDDLARLTELLAKGTLIALGYHQHDRTWRKRRDRTDAS